MNNNKGFSLIELSIVLIIIGLLVAGITGGASLIKSAELRSVMSDIRNYQTAINAYYTSTGELPGTNGSSEMQFFNSPVAWDEMADEGIIDITLTDTTAETSNANFAASSQNSVPSKIKGGFYSLGYNNQMLANVIFLSASGASGTQMAGATTTTPATSTAGPSIVSKKDAKFLDDKMDNGISDSGKFYGFTGTSSVSDTQGCVYDNSDITENETNKVCSISISIGL